MRKPAALHRKVLSSRSLNFPQSVPPQVASRTLLDRLKDARCNLFASRRFHRFAADFLPTRAIAHASAAKAFDLCAGFVYSQILLACVEFELLQKLQLGSQTVDDLATALGLPIDGTDRLLKAASALEFWSKPVLPNVMVWARLVLPCSPIPAFSI